MWTHCINCALARSLFFERATSTASTESTAATRNVIVVVIVVSWCIAWSALIDSLAVIVVFLAIIKILFAVNPIQPFVNVCLWDIFSCDDLANSFTPLKHVHLLGAANTASKREDTTFTRVSIRRRVGDTERAVNAMAIFNNWALTAIVAALAHVMSAKAAVESYSAAVHAFPVNLGPAVDLAISLTGSHFFKDAGLAEKIFL